MPRLLLLVVLAAFASAPALADRVYSDPRHNPETWTWNVPEPLDGVRHGELYSEAMQRTIGYNVYLPPDYDREPERRYPVVYFLHGATGTERSDAGWSRTVDAEIRAGRIAPVIYVFPNGGQFSNYADWPDANVKAETWIVRELIPHIDRTYRTLATREGRAAAGFSMGGDGATRLAMKHPDLFCAVASLAGAFGWGPGASAGDSAQVWSTQNIERLRGRLALMFVVGDQDRLLKRHHVFLAHLDQLELPYRYSVHPDVGHNLGRLSELSGAAVTRWLASKYESPQP